jgi:hypothetical protein
VTRWMCMRERTVTFRDQQAYTAKSWEADGSSTVEETTIRLFNLKIAVAWLLKRDKAPYPKPEESNPDHISPRWKMSRSS